MHEYFILRIKGFGAQLTKGSPVSPSKQVQIGIWFTTLHSAPNPQAPKHGFSHFSLIQAKLLGQSGFIVHSGWQFGGVPI